MLSTHIVNIIIVNIIIIIIIIIKPVFFASFFLCNITQRTLTKELEEELQMRMKNEK